MHAPCRAGSARHGAVPSDKAAAQQLLAVDGGGRDAPSRCRPSRGASRGRTATAIRSAAPGRSTRAVLRGGRRRVDLRARRAGTRPTRRGDWARGRPRGGLCAATARQEVDPCPQCGHSGAGRIGPLDPVGQWQRARSPRYRETGSIAQGERGQRSPALGGGISSSSQAGSMVAAGSGGASIRVRDRRRERLAFQIRDGQDTRRPPRARGALGTSFDERSAPNGPGPRDRWRRRPAVTKVAGEGHRALGSRPCAGTGVGSSDVDERRSRIGQEQPAGTACREARTRTGPRRSTTHAPFERRFARLAVGQRPGPSRGWRSVPSSRGNVGVPRGGAMSRRGRGRRPGRPPPDRRAAKLGDHLGVERGDRGFPKTSRARGGDREVGRAFPGREGRGGRAGTGAPRNRSNTPRNCSSGRIRRIVTAGVGSAASSPRLRQRRRARRSARRASRLLRIMTDHCAGRGGGRQAESRPELPISFAAPPVESPGYWT